MAGKADHATQEAAIAKVAEIVPYAAAVRRHLEAVLASHAFRSSPRSQGFLRFVIENALDGQFERLKERSLGIDLFGREADYNTGDDSIVRVSATDVRKRLLQYYLEPGHDNEFRIELPSGSYIPEIQRLAMEAPPGPAQLPEPVMAAPARTFPLRAVIGGICLSILGFASGVFAWNLTQASTSAKVASSRSADNRFYRDLLGPILADSPMETQIVLSNPRLLLYAGSTDSQSADEPAGPGVRVPPGMEQVLSEAANDRQASFPYHFFVLTKDDYTGMGEALSAVRVSNLLQLLGKTPHLTQARFLNWESARKEHLILLGAPHMSAWTQESLNNASFSMGHDEIVNTRPAPGEPRVYRRSMQGSLLEDYGLIWMAQSPSGSRLLLLAGLTSTGTAGVGDFFTNPARMKVVYERLKAAVHERAIPAEWQVIVKIHARQNVPIDVSFVNLRVNGT